MISMQVQLYGVTADDIQAIFQRVVEEHDRKNKVLPRWLYFDCSYLYNFELDDFEHVRKFNLLCRYDLKAVLEWHKYLEKWMAGDYCDIGGHKIKPIKIARSLDRVVNEGMEDVAKHLIGAGAEQPFKWHAIGSGVFSEVLPSDRAMVNQVSRIDVTADPNGGALIRDGSTVYLIGNHPKSIEQGDMTELGAFNAENVAADIMLDHSKFNVAITHQINQDVVGGTIIIWMCSS